MYHEYYWCLAGTVKLCNKNLIYKTHTHYITKNQVVQLHNIITMKSKFSKKISKFEFT